MVSFAKQGRSYLSTMTECFPDARETLEWERQLLDSEIDAFDTFQREVQSLEVTSRPDGHASSTEFEIGATIEYSIRSSVSPIQDIYVNTVMSVPHYDEEYDEDWFESVLREFNPELATALRRTSGVPEYLKQQFLTAARTARDNRQQVRDHLDREEEILDAAAAEISSIGEELAAIRSRPFSDCSPAELERLQDDLNTLRTRCRDAAEQRQNGDWHQHSPQSSTLPTLNEYLYATTDSTYPVLREIARVSDRLETISTQIDRWQKRE